MRALAAIAAAAVMLAASPALAQDRDAEIAALRSRLEAQESAIQDLQAQLNALRAPAPAPAEPSAAPTPSARVETASIVAADRPSGPSTADGAEQPTWQVAPPGPADRSLLRAADGRALAFEFVTGVDSGRASFAFTRSRDRNGEGDGAPAAPGVAAVNDTISLSFSAPASDDGDTPFATLDGLATGTKLEFEYSQSRRRVRTTTENDADPLVMQARAECAIRQPAYKPGCVRFDGAFVEEFFTPEKADEYYRALAEDALRSALDWSARAAVGYDEFTYYPLATLAKTTDEEVSWSAGVGLTAYPFALGSLAFDLDYERSYDEAKKITACPIPAPGATSVTCVPGPLAAPELVDKLILASEARYLWRIDQSGLLQNVGFAPRLEIDLLNSELAFDLPIYLVADAKDGLTGGVRVGYTTEEDEVILGIFIAKTFSIFQ